MRRPAASRRALLGAAMLLAALSPPRPAAAQRPGADAGAVAPGDGKAPGFGVVQRVLAAAMTQSAGALRARHRHVATRALDRARRLARFADTAWLAFPADTAFGAARRAVERARHGLQTGRPEEAADVLDAGARTLAGAALGDTRPPRPDVGTVTRAAGRPVLGLQGEEIGEIEGFRGAGGGRSPSDVVLVSVGGFLGLGARTVEVPADGVLLGRDYAMVVEDVAGALGGR